MLTLARITNDRGHLRLKLKLLRIKLLGILGNDGGGDFIDGLTSPVADPLQVGKHLF